MFDLQCEGIRSQYNYDLFLSSSNKLLLIEKVLTALGSNDDSIAVDQIYDLAKLLTINGDRNCIDVMKLNFRYHDNEDGFIGEDSIIELCNEKGILFVGKEISKRLLEHDEYEGEYFFIRGLREVYSESEIRTLLSSLCSENKRFNDYVDSSFKINTQANIRSISRYSTMKFEELLDCLENQHPSFVRAWEKHARSEEIDKVAKYIVEANDLQIKSKLLRVFRNRIFPEGIENILTFLDLDEYDISLNSVEVLKHFNDMRIRYKAIELLNSKANWYDYIPLLSKNFKQNDYELLNNLISKGIYDEFEWHSIQLSLNELFSLHSNENTPQLYLKLLNNNHCTICRRQMFKYMWRDGCLTPDIIESAKLDGNDETRVMVKTFEENANYNS